jgi:hypothetical protein
MLWRKYARMPQKAAFRIENRGVQGLWKKMPQATFLYTLKSPMRFSVSTPACAGSSTYSTFGILRFTVLSRLGRRESYQRIKTASTEKKILMPGKCLWLDTAHRDRLLRAPRMK